jgi:transposase
MSLKRALRRYARRVEDDRLPRSAAEREAYARTVGGDGLALLDRLDEPATPEALRRLPKVEVLRRVWACHFARDGGPPPGNGGVRFRPKEELPPAAEKVERPTTRRRASAAAATSAGPGTSST